MTPTPQSPSFDPTMAEVQQFAQIQPPVAAAFDTLEQVDAALATLPNDLPTNYAIFVLAFERLRARGMCARTLIEGLAELEADRGGGH